MRVVISLLLPAPLNFAASFSLKVAEYQKKIVQNTMNGIMSIESHDFSHNFREALQNLTINWISNEKWIEKQWTVNVKYMNDEYGPRPSTSIAWYRTEHQHNKLIDRNWC